MLNTTKPTKGQTMKVHGMICTIVKVWPLGTVDVEAPDGRRFRITGLSFV